MIVYDAIGAIVVSLLIVLGIFKAIEIWKARGPRNGNTPANDQSNEPATGGTDHE